MVVALVVRGGLRLCSRLGLGGRLGQAVYLGTVAGWGCQTSCPWRTSSPKQGISVFLRVVVALGVCGGLGLRSHLGLGGRRGQAVYLGTTADWGCQLSCPWRTSSPEQGRGVFRRGVGAARVYGGLWLRSHPGLGGRRGQAIIFGSDGGVLASQCSLKAWWCPEL